MTCVMDYIMMNGNRQHDVAHLLDRIPWSVHAIGLMASILDRRDVAGLLRRAGLWLAQSENIVVPLFEGEEIQDVEDASPPLEYTVIMNTTWGAHVISFPQLDVCQTFECPPKMQRFFFFCV